MKTLTQMVSMATSADAIIDPAKTREVLMTALEACALNPEVERFNPGVIQT